MKHFEIKNENYTIQSYGDSVKDAIENVLQYIEINEEMFTVEKLGEIKELLIKHEDWYPVYRCLSPNNVKT